MQFVLAELQYQCKRIGKRCKSDSFTDVLLSVETLILNSRLFKRSLVFVVSTHAWGPVALFPGASCPI